MTDYYSKLLATASLLICSQVISVEQRVLITTYKKIRCPECRAQSIAESELPSAIRLRKEIEVKLRDGWREQEIIENIKQRYGNEMVMVSEVNADNMALWLVPVVCGFTMAYQAVRRSHQNDSGRV